MLLSDHDQVEAVLAVRRRRGSQLIGDCAGCRPENADVAQAAGRFDEQRPLRRLACRSADSAMMPVPTK